MQIFLISFIVAFIQFFTAQSLATEIKLGMSTALTGPTKNLGLQLRKGAQLYFNNYNKTPAGLKHPITLISYDDGYEPQNTVLNTRKLLEHDKVFALFGYVGTPTSKAIMPLISKDNAIFFSPFTGAEFLRSPLKRSIFNIRASYYNEAATQVKYFVEKLKLKNVALFIQADDFGLSASEGYAKALKVQGIKEYTQVRYKRNTIDIDLATKQLKDLKPEVIFCIGTYSPIANLINNLRAEKVNSKVVMLSFAGAFALKKELNNFDDIYITSVLPDPHRSELQIIKQYRQEMLKSELSNESLEGYVNAATFVQIISQISGEITPHKFIQSAEQLNISLGGVGIKFSKNNHQALDKTYLNLITKNGLLPVN